MNLRKAIPDDAFAIARAHVDSWRSAYRGLAPDDRLAGLDYARGAGRFRESILVGLEEIYIAEEDGEVVGFLAFGRPRDSDVTHETTGEIYAMYLLSQYWRKGIGGSMLKKAERILGSQGCLRVTLWVLEGNERARRFYEAMGFTADGATKISNIGRPLNTLRYSKPL